jgi:hypothetical protein
MQVLALGRRLHRCIDSEKFDRCSCTTCKVETRDETRCDAISNSSEPKKKEVCKLERPIQRINNEDIKNILIQLVGAVMKIGSLP